jgi:hypothetical protein
MSAGLAFALLALQSGAIDWAALPALPYRAPPLVTPGMNDFAGREAKARRCPLLVGNSIAVELAILVEANGEIRTIVPRAIDCATVEQYAAGLVGGFARGNLLPRTATGPTWYKTSLTFKWEK